ncbi:hypothetical protein [Agarilytica rhodophyticola]|uniref:hypothetical protein n=1 Tax=Agarilytica rhodophyticola TaxID=1737490 RepID=UPI0013152EB2|nr:hypothetical protein [Agarilytica rhodophyticola]
MKRDFSNTPNVYDLCERLARDKMPKEILKIFKELSPEKQQDVLAFIRQLVEDKKT